MAERIGGLNLVLLGKIGAGKSASGNTILGQKSFESKESFSSVTQDVAVESGWVCGRRVTVYDTPGLFNTKLSEVEIQQMINEKVLQKCESGLCVFLLVIKADRFTRKERETVEKIEEMLGEERLKKTWILFTGRDELEEESMSIDEFIYETEPLVRLVQKYHQRYHVFNNKKREPNGQVQELLTKIYSTYPDTIEKGAKPKHPLGERRQCIPGPRIPVNSVFRSPVKQVLGWNIRKTDVERSNILSPVRLKVLLGEPDTSRWIVLLGKTGVGKSASGNTILGQREFISERSMRSVTCECSEKHTTVSGRSVSVVDTPGFFHTQMNSEELMTEIAWSVYLFSPGPHTFLIVFNLNMRFTEQEQQIAEQIKTLFGGEVFKYSIILFTHGDLLDGETVETHIKQNSALRDLVDQCGGRFHIFNNRDVNNRDQVNDLLKKIDTMIKQNGGGHYSYQMFQDPLRFRREEEERRLREEEERKQQEEKLRQEEIERVRKETERRVRAEFEGSPRILQERIKLMRLRDEDRKQQEEIKRERRPNRGLMSLIVCHRPEMMRKQAEEQRQEDIERVIKETERRIREEFKGPPRLFLERFKLMRLREEAEKTQQEEIERVRKETEERIRAKYEGPPRFLLERFKAMRLSEKEEKTQREEKQRQEEIERVRKETEERIRAEFEGPPRFLQERLKALRLSVEERIRQEVEYLEEFDRDLDHLRSSERPLEMRLMEMSDMEMRLMEMSDMEMSDMKMGLMEMRLMEMRRMEMGLMEMSCMEMRRMQMSCMEMRRMEMRRMEMRRMEMRRMERRDMEMRRIEMRRMEIKRMEMSYMEMKRMEMSDMEMRRMEISYMEMRRMEMRRMEMIHKEMQIEIKEEIERVIKETEEKIRAEFEGPPR